MKLNDDEVGKLAAKPSLRAGEDILFTLSTAIKNGVYAGQHKLFLITKINRKIHWRIQKRDAYA